MSWSLNGTPVPKAKLQHPATGTWTAVLQTLDDIAPSGAVTLALPGLSLRGVVAKRKDGTEDAGVLGGRCTVRLVGGAGKLGATISGQHFRAAPGRLVAEHLLQAAGELLDPASDASGLQTLLPHWAYFGGSCSAALEELSQALGCDWWITPEGLVHLGDLTWPATSPAGALVLDARQDLRRLDVALEDEALMPRTTYEGHKIVTVDHVLTERTWRARARWS